MYGEVCTQRPFPDTCVSLVHSHRFPKDPQGVTVWHYQPLILQLWTPGQQEAAKPCLPSTNGRSRGQDDGKPEVWQGVEKMINSFPSLGHSSSAIKVTPAATLRKPNLFNFSPVISGLILGLIQIYNISLQRHPRVQHVTSQAGHLCRC